MAINSTSYCECTWTREVANPNFVEIASRIAALEGSGIVSVYATMAALSAADASNMVTGTLAYVVEVDDIYELTKTGSHTADGLSILNATGGSWWWFSRNQGRYDDQQGDVTEGVGPQSLTNEAFRDTAFRMFFLRHNQDDELHFRFQFSHGWRYDLPVRPHLHLIPMADPAAAEAVLFNGYYAWSRPGQAAVPALSGWTTFTATLTVNPGDVYVQRVLSLGTLTPPAYARESTVLFIYVRRNGTAAGDTYTTSKDHGTAAANVGLVSVDVHWRRRNTGSSTELPTEG